MEVECIAPEQLAMSKGTAFTLIVFVFCKLYLHRLLEQNRTSVKRFIMKRNREDDDQAPVPHQQKAAAKLPSNTEPSSSRQQLRSEILSILAARAQKGTTA